MAVPKPLFEPPFQFDFVIYENATLGIGGYLEDADTGLPIPMPNPPYTGKLQIRSVLGDPDPPVVDLTTANGGVVVTPAQSLVEWTMTEDETLGLDLSQFPAGGAVYDIVVEDSLGIATRVIEGKVTLSPAVTRDPGDIP